METSHDIRLSDHRLAATISAAEKTAPSLDFKNRKCDICSQHNWTTTKGYVIHMGQHLEEISLACLPRDPEDSSDDGLEDADSSISLTTSNNAGIEESHHLSSTNFPSEGQLEHPAEINPNYPAILKAYNDLMRGDASRQDSKKPYDPFEVDFREFVTLYELSDQQKQEEKNSDHNGLTKEMYELIITPGRITF